MTDFFTNLVDRHFGTCETIQPRTLGRFEEDRGRVTASLDQGIDQIESGSDQILQVPQPPQPPQPSSDVSYELPKETAADINPREPMVANSDHPIDPQSTFSVKAPAVAIYEPDSIGSRDYSSSSQFGLTEQQTVLSNPPGVVGKSDNTQILDSDREFHSEAMEKEQQARPNKTRLAVDYHDAFSESYVQTNSNESHEIMDDKPAPPVLLVGGHTLENELGHRIQAMLQRLTDDSVSPATALASNDRGNQKNVEIDLASIPPEKKAPLLDAAIAPLQPASSMERQGDRQDRIPASDREPPPHHERLEAPSWLFEIETQFKQRLQEAEIKPEPVINVTIGRVEVRAVQPESQKNAPRRKKPTGVMTLDEYLKRREGGGPR